MFAMAIDDNASWPFYGILGSLIGCGLGYTVKENIIDNWYYRSWVTSSTERNSWK